MTPKSIKLADALFKLGLAAGGFASMIGFGLDESKWIGIGVTVMILCVLGIILTRWWRWWECD